MIWFHRPSLFAPKGMPQPILDRLADALDRALDDEKVRRRLAEIGCDVPDKARCGQPPLAPLVNSEIAAGHQSSRRQTSSWNEMPVASIFHKSRSANGGNDRYGL